MNTTLLSNDVDHLHFDVSRVAPGRPLTWVSRGWRDMRRHLGASLGYGALVVAVGWTLLIFCGTHPYYVAAAISGFLLMAPLVAAGPCEMSRRDAAGQAASFDDSLDGFARNAGALLAFGAMLAASALLWFAVSAVMLETVFHIAAPSLSETLYRGFIDSANRSQVTAYIVVGGTLAALVFLVSVVAVPLMVDRHATAGQAMRTSIKSVFANPAAMAVWSAVILVLTLFGYAPLLGGLLLIAPLLGHATWHAYRDLVR